MSRNPDPPQDLSADKQTLLALRKLRARVEELEREKHEPIAIVGLGCRFPGGADGADAYWKLLHDGVDAITEVPPDRWDIEAFYDPDPEAPGKMYTRSGGFIDRPDLFDPQFFGISPREAVSMDPQHRLVLEVSWEALEHAGLSPDRLLGAPVGVFVGLSTGDYGTLHIQRGDPALIDTYFGIGNAPNAAAGRVSYVLGLHGPAMAIDTACSSSLVAVHLACQSLRAGECRLALAGGVNAILTPEISINFSRARMMAPDGRCKTFDASADGYVRGEGCGMVALKRLSHALADGDRILALVRGSAVNQDGKSSGFTAPNELAQQAVIRQALKNAGLKPSDIQYLEAHGTGTSLGDPIEVQAAAAALGEGRSATNRLWIGSAKTNFGHLEAAAGIAGLIKIVLAMTHGEIPAHLHFKEPNPYIPWSELPVDVVAERMPWDTDGGPRRGGVSSFGFSGTNAHVILESAPVDPPQSASAERPRQILALSAKSTTALRALASRYATRLAVAPELRLADVCHTANTGRAHFGTRVALTGGSLGELRTALEEVAGGRGPAMPREVVPGDLERGVVFLFTGQGAQYPGMARTLFETEPLFRKTLETCSEMLQGKLERPLLSVLYPQDGEVSLLTQTGYTQPALFAIEYALSQLWRSWGIEPSAVIGHSIGEFAAACVAGVLTLEDALHAVALRGRLMQALPPGGAMAAVFASERQVRAALRGAGGRVAIAAENSPENTVISGDDVSVAAVLDRLAAENIRSQRLDVSHAFHSPLMDPMLEEFERVMASIATRPPRLPIVSNVTGDVVPAGFAFSGEYWARHARDAVRFQSGIRALLARGHRLFLEVGPTGTLCSFGRACATVDATWVASLRKGTDEWTQMLDAAGGLYVAGCRFDWPAFDRHAHASIVGLPTYPFERRRYWIDVAERRAPAAASSVASPAEPTMQAVEWRKIDLPQASGAGRVVLVGLTPDGPDSLDGLSAQAAAAGRSVIVLRPRADEAAPEAIGAALRVSGTDVAPPPTNVVLDWSAAGTAAAPPHGRRPALAEELPGIVQAILAAGGPITVTVLTRGAAGPDAVDQPNQAALWGFMAALATEHPELQPVCIDVGSDSATGQVLWRALHAGEGRIALRGNSAYVARLVSCGEPASVEPPPALASDAVYLVTGGFGGLGVHAIDWLVTRGARRVAILARRADSPAASALVERCERRGARVHFVSTDLSVRADVDRAIAEIEETLGPIRGLVHAAGALDDGIVEQQSAERVARVMGPKVSGLEHVSAAFSGRTLDLMVLFSSMAGVIGSAAQTNYAAANAYLDAFATRAARSGTRALSVSWGPFAATGMASDVAAVHRSRWADAGVGLMQPSDIGRLLDAALRLGRAHVVVGHVDWTRIARGAETRPAFLAELLQADPAGAAHAAVTPQDVNAADPQLREDLVRRVCRDAVAAVLRLDEVRDDRALNDLGVDSLMAIEIRNRIQRGTGVNVPVVLFLDGCTVAGLTTAVLTAVADSARAPRSPAPAVTAHEAEVLLGHVDELSDADVERLLAALSAPPAGTPSL